MRNGAVRLRSTIAPMVAVVIVIGVSGCSSTPRDTAQGEITRVVDGGTVAVLIDGTDQSVRLLNVETPSTVDDQDSADCLRQESFELTERLVPPGSTVRLEFATQRVDASGQTVAAVFVNDASVNEAIVAAGLGVPDVGDGETRFLSGISAAYREAGQAGVGLFSAYEECTVPGQVMAATGIDCVEVAGAMSASASPGSSTSPATTSSATQSASETVTGASALSVAVTVGSGSEELKKQARTAAATLATAVDLRSRAAANANSLIWRALNQAQRESCTGTINDLVQRSTHDHAALLAAVVVAEKQEADAARIAEEQRKAAEAEAARVADELQKAAEAARVAEEQRVAAETEAARVIAAQAAANQAAEEQRQESNNNGSSSSGGSNNSGNSSGGSSPSGYTGPRCYAPGGKTWTPC